MKKIRIPFGVQIVAILLVGVVASGVAFFIARNIATKHQNDNLERHAVKFAYQDGTMIGTKEVTHGKGVIPPEPKSADVFRGWSTALNIVENDVEAHPIFYTIKENNLFFFDSVYVQENKEFSLNLYVGGHVSISSGELTLEYDVEVMEFVGTSNGVSCSVTETTEGELVLRFNSDTAIKEETLLSQLRFYAKEKDAYATEVILKASGTKVIANGQEIPVDSATINNKVFFLQEVG